MKRSKALVRFSHEHHLVLVYVRRVKLNPPDSEAFKKLLHDFPARWKNEIEPHFAEEERLFPPRLLSAGADELVEQFNNEHAELRKLASQAAAGDPAALKSFGKLVYDHIRFEERRLYPRYEELVGP